MWVSDEALHKIMDINKVFPKPREVEEELRKKREEDEVKAEKEELQRIKSLAPPVQPPKMVTLQQGHVRSSSSLASIGRGMRMSAWVAPTPCALRAGRGAPTPAAFLTDVPGPTW